jgi:hypothetical protein
LASGNREVSYMTTHTFENPAKRVEIRKAIEEVGHYMVKERPNGGWSVAFCLTPDKLISVHTDKPVAMAAARRYNDEERK